MWHRLALLAAIMHPRKPPYITQMSDFLKVFWRSTDERHQVTDFLLPLARGVNRMKCTIRWIGCDSF
jgi:hypothetical protein